MDTEVTAMYCITDAWLKADWLKARRHQESLQREVTDAEVMTVALAAARFFEGNFDSRVTSRRPGDTSPREATRCAA